MKKLFTMFTVVAISTTMSFAQQGSVAIGVGSNLANVSWVEYELIPTVGYFITDNMMVGTGFSMGSSSEENVEFIPSAGLGLGDRDISNFSISPFLRYYMNDAFFVSAGIEITSSSNEWKISSNPFSNPYSNEVSTSSFGLNAGVGYSLMWNERICIEPSIGIATSSGTSENSTNDNSSVTSFESDAPSTFGMAIGLGINIRLGGE